MTSSPPNYLALRRFCAWIRDAVVLLLPLFMCHIRLKLKQSLSILPVVSMLRSIAVDF